MKKMLLIIIILVLGYSILQTEKIIIPKESIRLRVIANSNSEQDQAIKKEVSKRLVKELKQNQKETLEETRKYIKKELPTFEKIISRTLQDNQAEKDFKIQYGNNYFPKKEYDNIIYEEGEYESLVVSIGKGTGKNYWCVLFPPLCFIDETKEVQYTSWIKEILEKYF